MSPKNLLFLFSDQHAARVMGCAGDAHAVTPALDRLAGLSRILHLTRKEALFAEGEPFRVPWEQTRYSGLLDLHACDVYQLFRCAGCFAAARPTPGLTNETSPTQPLMSASGVQCSASDFSRQC